MPASPLGAPAVPPLTISSPRSPRTVQLTVCSPRTALYSPRTHREQLELVGSEISEALATATDIAKEVVQLSARAERQRAEFVAKVAQDAAANMDANAQNACPVCMETLADPRACPNRHQFCGDCLKRIYRHSYPQFQCPLCRIALSPTILLHELQLPAPALEDP